LATTLIRDTVSKALKNNDNTESLSENKVSKEVEPVTSWKDLKVTLLELNNLRVPGLTD